jgi:serine phosphatase RsbU (regulator of sigma subunit)/CHASE1-domain containing sensor protein/anti-sigma regulatory factor (Ser/Thr protein kinase)
VRAQPDVARSPRVSAPGRLVGALLVGALIALAIVSSVSSYVLRRNQVRDDRSETARIAAQTLSGVMQQTLAAMRGAGAVVKERGQLDPDAFASFGRGLQVQPGLSALALEATVSASERHDFERRRGFRIVDSSGPGQFDRAPERAEYAPVIAVSPESPVTTSLLGFDVENDPQRGPVVREALDAGSPRMSPPIQFPVTGSSGIFVVTPLFHREVPLDTTEERREAVVGYVSASYLTSDIASLVRQRLPRGTGLRILDGTRLVSGSAQPMSGERSQRIEIGGRTWTVAVTSTATASIRGPLGLLLAGLLLAGLVQLVITLARRREIALEQVRLRLEREARRTVAMQSLSSSLLMIDSDDAFATILLHRCQEVFEADRCAVGLLVEGGSALELRGLGGRAAAWRRRVAADANLLEARAARSGVPVTNGSDVAVRLEAEGSILGGMSIGYDDGRTIDDHERDLLEALARRGARALERLRLFHESRSARRQAEQDRARVESQRQLSVRLSRAATAEEAAQIVLGTAVRILAAPAGAIALAREEGDLEFVASHGIAEGNPSRMPRPTLVDRMATTQAYRTGNEVMAATSTEYRERFPDGYAIAGGRGRAVWALPLVAEGATIGALFLVFDEGSPPTEDDRSTIRALAAQVAQALRRARTSDVARDAAERLQRAMLPADLPAPAGLSVRGLYRAAGEHVEVGGDWYDAVELADGRLMVAVGDVVGRGIGAAATMGQLRVAWRALAAEAEGPASLLRALDRFSRHLPGAEMTTVACAEVDRLAHRVRYACAGHLPPLLLDRDGRGRFLEEGRCMALAVTEQEPFEEGIALLREGDTLVLFTDGLVERREISLVEGFEQLRHLAERFAGSRDDLGEALAAAMIDEERSADDVAMLTITVVPALERSLAADPAGLAPTRAAMRGWLDERHVGSDDIADIVLATGEALANAIEHPDTRNGEPIHVLCWQDGSDVIVRVVDHGPWGSASPGPSRGNGITLMKALMDGVRIQTDEQGARVELRRSLATGSRPGAGGA